ncbi:MAG: hypothetical protein KJP00_13205 [Bacteroidia bacterium]|nr:hypothetical protein [Bacteroidia bacterium]
MFKHVLSIGLCLLFVISGIAQEVTLSEALPLRNEISYYLIGKMRDKHLVLRERPGSFLLNAYNQDMTLGWEKEIMLEKRRPKIIETFDIEDRFFILYSHRTKGDLIIKMHKYDAAANLVDSVEVSNLGSSLVTPNFDILQSENRKNIQIRINSTPGDIRLVVFNTDEMRALYDIEFDPPDFNPFLDYGQLLIDNEGSSYFIVERDNRRLRKKGHHFSVFGYQSYSDRKFNFNISMGGRITYDVTFVYDNLNHAIVGAGYYSDKAYARADGTFYLRSTVGDPSSRVLKFKRFDNQLLETVEGKNRRQKRYLTEIRVKELILRRDGGALIVGEKFKRLDSRTASGARITSGYGGFNPFNSDYFFDDLFIIAHDPSGEMHWTNFFYKRQYSKNDLGVFSSYFVMKTPSKLRFLFNDEIVQNNTVSEYIVEPTGKYDRNALLNANYQNVKLRFVNSKQVASNELVVPSEFKNELRLLRVQY